MMGRNTAGREARKKGAIPPEAIRKGIQLHLTGVSIRKAAKDTELPYPTLRRYIIKYLKNRSCSLEPHYNASKVFTDEQEESLKEYVLDCANKFYGLTSKDYRRIAYQMAEINKINMPPSWQLPKMAGRDWMRGFRARHPQLSIKKPEACSMVRATAFNKSNVQKFFDNLKQVLNRNPSFANGTRIYNLGETSTITVQRPQKVLAARGSNVCRVTSGERGTLVTTCCIVNAIGQALPPAMIFPRKNFKSHMLHGAPPGTLGLATPSGWMNAQLFVEVMKHFIKFSSASIDNPALLILDNHESHLSIEALDIAKVSGITVLTLHPHTTARMQLLDVGLNAPFKTYYNAAIDSWLLRNPGKTVSIYNIAEFVGVAYMRAMTPTNITQAFQKCGIFPFDDQIFTEVNFLPSEVTDRPEPENITNAPVDCQEHNDMERCGSASILTPAFYNDNDETDVEMENTIDAYHNSVPVPSSSYDQQTSLAIDNKTKENLSNATLDTYKNTPQVIPSSQKTEIYCIASTSKINNQATTSSSTQALSPITTRIPDNFISPKIFRPPLKAGPRKKRFKRKAGKSMIATDTPEEDALAENRSRKKAKVVKKDLFVSNVKNEKSVTTSDEEYEEYVISSGSSSGGEIFFEESEEEEIILSDNFPPLSRKPLPEDHVIIAFQTKKTKVYFIAQILEELEGEDCDYYVSYFKLKNKVAQTFSLPLEPDTAGVKRNDIKYILPPPKTTGTIRRQATYKFPIDMSLLNFRY